MPELPEVETVRRTLERQILNKTITDVKVYYERMLENCTKEDFDLRFLRRKESSAEWRLIWLLIK